MYVLILLFFVSRDFPFRYSLVSLNSFRCLKIPNPKFVLLMLYSRILCLGYLLNSLNACKNSFCCVLIVSLYFVTRLSTLFMYRTTVATIDTNAVSITTRNVPLSDDVSFVSTFHVSFIVSLSTISLGFSNKKQASKSLFS